MIATVLELSERAALSLFFAHADSVNAMSEGGQVREDFEYVLAQNIEMRNAQFSDDAVFTQFREAIKSDPAMEDRLQVEKRRPEIIRAFAVNGDVVENIKNGVLSIAVKKDLSRGDLCVVPSMKFAIAMVYLRLESQEPNQSMGSLMHSARKLYARFLNEKDTTLFAKVTGYIETKHPEGPAFVEAQLLPIVQKLLAEGVLTAQLILSMLASGELLVREA